MHTGAEVEWGRMRKLGAGVNQKTASVAVGVLLSLSASCALAASSNKPVASGVKSITQPVPSTALKRWVTSPQSKMAEAEPLHWEKEQRRAGKIDESDVLIDDNKKAQTILGFGAALTDSSCYLLNRLPEDQKQKVMDELFNPSKMGMSTARIAIGSSDYALVPYSFDDGDEDPELKRFSIKHDEENILPILRMARKAYPDLFIFGSAWSPPGWMKPNKSMLGGNMPRKHLGTYAQYFAKFLKGYESAGVPVQAVTVNNEVDTDQDGRMPACVWPQEIEVDFVGLNLGPVLEREKINTKIWLLDHNYNLWGRVCNELENADVRKYANGVAWHPYAGSPQAMKKVLARYPGLGMHWTEDGPDVDEPGYASNWTKWGKLYSEALQNSCNSITGWNLALDEVGRPNIGPFKCGGMITIDSKSQKITYSGQYWGTVHFSKVIRPGAKLISSESKQAELSHTVVQNPDGNFAAVLTNSAKAPVEVCLRWRQSQCKVQLPADSITSLSW